MQRTLAGLSCRSPRTACAPQLLELLQDVFRLPPVTFPFVFHWAFSPGTHHWDLLPFVRNLQCPTENNSTMHVATLSDGRFDNRDNTCLRFNTCVSHLLTSYLAIACILSCSHLMLRRAKAAFPGPPSLMTEELLPG